MAATKMNVLVYSGNGSTIESVRHCLYSLRRLLSSNYAVIPVTGDVIIKEPWTISCALLVFPGGADLGYCRTLNGEGNRRISQYVRRGGSYLGLCAGGYYGSSRCEFEIGNKHLEVVGSRELAFFPGTCRGCAYPGFVYHSEDGARATELSVQKEAFAGGVLPDVFRSYYNGGGVFVDAAKHRDDGVEVLAKYVKPIAVDGGDGRAAVVHCKIGDGGALLTGPHPEFAAANLNKAADGAGFSNVVDQLTEDNRQRTDFLKACLVKLGLTVSQEEQAVPSLSRLHLSSLRSSDLAGLLQELEDLIVKEDDEEYIKGENDTFQFHRPTRWSLGSIKDALPSTTSGDKDKPDQEDSGILDYNAIVKHVQLHETEHPACKETPYFNHHAYYSNLHHYQSLYPCDVAFGNHLMYGEVVTSTNTMLEKNSKLLRSLPTGFTATATVQLAGRGRGSNVWVSPAGSLMFSTCIRHPMKDTSQAPVVFVQYLAALAIVKAVKSYDRGYENTPVKLKWPNDIYAEDPTKPGENRHVKIGGILVNSSYSGQEYLMVVGIGLNTTNPSPTTSLNALLPPHLPAFTLEKLLARILTAFSTLYTTFLSAGVTDALLAEYYQHWLHTDQIVTLESENGARARIKGITRDWGLLRAEELGWQDAPTGRVWELQSDANSFDFLKGLVRRKG
ncbi:MAG: biotin holocarboxylase synthetase [Piccolia ochrophora]|nr:MAG: biotin holocarboxylase synthetase [Piccolia ochrophora]